MTNAIGQKRTRCVPVVRNAVLRTAVGFVLLAGAFLAATAIFRSGWLEVLLPGSALAWAIATCLTQKYIHKYPQRYFTYLLASHGKAAVVMAPLLAALDWAAGPTAAPWDVVWVGFALFVVADALVSALSRRQVTEERRENPVLGARDPSASDPASSPGEAPSLVSVDRQAILERISSGLPGPVVEFIERSLPDARGECSDAVVLDRCPKAGVNAKCGRVGLLVSQARLNDIYDLTAYLLSCADRVAMGGYVLVRYAPLEGERERLRNRYGRALYGPAAALHFLWYETLPKTPFLDVVQHAVTRRGNRALSKAEVWGRLAYCGLHVVAESSGVDERHVIARRVGPPVQGKTPSYYPIIGLDKVGLDGKIMRLHKLRSMFPYSEFLQKRMYEEHGLTSTGKFANDFRITRFGRFVRRYWLDELPQAFDWLRGDIKLVGMRATSPQYLSLYPRDVTKLYIQVKPGLVPPIFDESTNGFDQIVRVEHAYLKQYLAAPIRTDVTYFFRTWTDILRRGVRGK